MGAELSRKTDDSEGTDGVRISTEVTVAQVNVMHPNTREHWSLVMQLGDVVSSKPIEVVFGLVVDVWAADDSWVLVLSLLSGQGWSVRHASLQEGSYTDVSIGSNILRKGMSAISMSDHGNGSRLHRSKGIGTVDSMSTFDLVGDRLTELWLEDLCSGRQLWTIGRGRCAEEDIIVDSAVQCQYVCERRKKYSTMCTYLAGSATLTLRTSRALV